MAILRSALLAMSQSRWLRERAPKYRFVRRTVSRFMPGETVGEALDAASELQQQGIGTLLTLLGENVTEASEARATADQYLGALRQIRERGLRTQVSVKLTQFGLDLSSGECYSNLKRIIEDAGESSTVWIDMEASQYVDITLELYRRARTAYRNVGVCLQAYLYRTARDLAALLPLGPAIRLVKGAYKEPAAIAFPSKKDVDENFVKLAQMLFQEPARRTGARAGIATHDLDLIARITKLAAAEGVAKDEFEFQMLYGIQRREMNRLTADGYRGRILISYGAYWFPWFMRRLAERPANVSFIVRNLFSE